MKVVLAMDDGEDGLLYYDGKGWVARDRGFILAESKVFPNVAEARRAFAALEEHGYTVYAQEYSDSGDFQRDILLMQPGVWPSGAEREPGDPLTIDCEHGKSEDCMNCTICGRCSETLDENDICSDCAEQVIEGDTLTQLLEQLLEKPEAETHNIAIERNGKGWKATIRRQYEQDGLRQAGSG